MNNTALGTQFEIDNWKSELAQLVSSASTEEEKVALEAFAQAMKPYLNNPMALRTVLGKIQRTFLAPDVQNNIEQGEFSSLEELKALLPKDVNIRVEA
jgi:hypothetical protein